MTHEGRVRQALLIRGAQGAAVIEISTRNVLARTGEELAEFRETAELDALCQMVQMQTQASFALGASQVEELLLVVTDGYLIGHLLGPPPEGGEPTHTQPAFLFVRLRAELGNLGLALPAIKEAARATAPP